MKNIKDKADVELLSEVQLRPDFADIDLTTKIVIDVSGFRKKQLVGSFLPECVLGIDRHLVLH